MIKSFAVIARNHQLAWALNGGVPATALEVRHRQLSWVLKRECRKLNLFRPEWWGYIAHAQHRWSRALNSSQCFAVNIFAPLADDSARALTALQLLLPSRNLQAGDRVSVRFEYTPENAPVWMGEYQRPTQVDVYFVVTRSHRCIGHVFVEVKYSETSSGYCSGWKDAPGNPTPNPDPSRCLNTSEIIASPWANCWKAQAEGRRYWQLVSELESSIRIEAIRFAGTCPFRHGLYQLMRNRVLADELARHSGAWADFILCRHPGNDAVVRLAEPVLSVQNAIKAFRLLSSEKALCDWDAKELVGVIGSTDGTLEGWQEWMTKRYFP